MKKALAALCAVVALCAAGTAGASDVLTYSFARGGNVIAGSTVDISLIDGLATTPPAQIDNAFLVQLPYVASCTPGARPAFVPKVLNFGTKVHIERIPSTDKKIHLRYSVSDTRVKSIQRTTTGECYADQPDMESAEASAKVVLAPGEQTDIRIHTEHRLHLAVSSKAD
jgi:hypothetical protein